MYDTGCVALIYILLRLHYILKSILWRKMDLRLNTFTLVRDKNLPEIKGTEKGQQLRRKSVIIKINHIKMQVMCNKCQRST